MIMYRPHRGGLVESLLEVRSFQNVNDMFDFICKTQDRLLQSLIKSHDKNSDICLAIESTSYYDDRCGWDTRAVLCNDHVIGYCDLNVGD